MSDPADTPRPRTDRWPHAWRVTGVVVLAAAAFALTVVADRGGRSTGGYSPVGIPGRADRLDAEQSRRAQAQAVADRFATTFADYLAGDASPQRLRRAGATDELVQRITAAPQRASAEDPKSRRRPTGVVVQPDRNGWIAATSLHPTTERTSGRKDQMGVPLTFRLEHHHGRTVVVDVNAGGRE